MKEKKTMMRSKGLFSDGLCKFIAARLDKIRYYPSGRLLFALFFVN